MDGRMSVSAGDFFAEVPPGADMYILSWILHDWSDDECLTILRRTRTAMKPGMSLLVAERLLDPNPKASAAMEYLSDIQMMVLGGTERTQDEYQSLLAHSGFVMAAVTPTHSAVHLIEARAA